MVSGLAIVPLAGLMRPATENLAESLGAGIGRLLNATFGDAAELMIGLIALAEGARRVAAGEGLDHPATRASTWPVVALFGTVLTIWAYFRYGRLVQQATGA